MWLGNPFQWQAYLLFTCISIFDILQNRKDNEMEKRKNEKKERNGEKIKDEVKYKYKGKSRRRGVESNRNEKIRIAK